MIESCALRCVRHERHTYTHGACVENKPDVAGQRVPTGCLAEAGRSRGQLRRGLAPREASGAPAGRRLCHLACDIARRLDILEEEPTHAHAGTRACSDLHSTGCVGVQCRVHGDKVSRRLLTYPALGGPAIFRSSWSVVQPNFGSNWLSTASRDTVRYGVASSNFEARVGRVFLGSARPDPPRHTWGNRRI